MTVGKVRSRKVGDIEEAKKRAASRGSDYALTVKADSDLVVRILAEPEEWREFPQHYLEDADPRSFPCNDGFCKGCDAGNSASRKWAIPVIDVTDNKVRVYVCGSTVWNKLIKGNKRRGWGYDQAGTMLDRNYIITRSGSGKNDTEYEVDADEESRMNLKKYREDIAALDLDEWLAAQIPAEEDENDRRGSRSKRRSSLDKAPRRRTAPRQRDDDDDDEEDDDEDVELPWKSERSSSRRSTRKPGGVTKTAAKRPMRRR